MKTITITLSIPSYASTYAELGSENLDACVAAWGDYLEAELTSYLEDAEVSVETTHEVFIEDEIDCEEEDRDAIREAMHRIGNRWWSLSDAERREYGFPA